MLLEERKGVIRKEFFLCGHNLVIECKEGSTYNIEKVENISLCLARLLPNLKIESYFKAKPEVILNSDFVVTALNKETFTAVAVLCAKVFTCQQYYFLNIATLLIGQNYQGTKLFNYLWKTLFQSILFIYPTFVDSITLKTYNPVSMSLLFKVGNRAKAGLYPNLENINETEVLFLEQIVEKLGIHEYLDKQRGIVYGGAVGVPTDFYPKLPAITDQRIIEMFAPPLSPSDRILGCIFMLENHQKLALLKQFGISFDVKQK